MLLLLFLGVVLFVLSKKVWKREGSMAMLALHDLSLVLGFITCTTAIFGHLIRIDAATNVFEGKLFAFGLLSSLSVLLFAILVLLVEIMSRAGEAYWIRKQNEYEISSKRG